MTQPDPSAPRAPDSQESCLAEGGELGRLVRAVDWSKTPLGPVAGWPTSLKTLVGVVLRNRFPMLLWWGPELIQIYNDGYRPILGEKHPTSLGAPALQVWSEIWDVIGPMARSVLDGGQGTWNESLLLLINRRGFPEETYHTFSYSPVPAEGGHVGGVLVTVNETTEQVQDDRQLRMLGALASRAAEAKSAEQACRTATGILSENDADLPFSLLYLLDADARELQLVSASGLDGYEGPGRPTRVPFDARSGDTGGWPFAEAARTGREAVVEDLPKHFGPMPGGRWGIPSTRAVVLPLSRPGQPHPYGFLVSGVSPRRMLDGRYLGLFRLTADQVVTAIANARAYEEERQRVEALAELDRAKTAFFSNVSHEFRTPLTLMLGPTEDALASPARALTGENLETVHRNALRLLKLVNSLLDFARIEAGRVQASYAPVDLAELTAGRLSAPVHPVMDIVAGARILLADDNADMREYVGRLLAERWKVEMVADGAAALEAARARPPDLVLTDVMMPGLDGFGLLRELRADERTRNVPVIILSARAGEEAHVEGLRAGANDYLVKPFSARELVARVESQLARARLRTVEEEHHQRLARVFQHAPVAIVIVRGPEHVFEFANAHYLQLISNRPVMGRSVREALPELAEQGICELLDSVYTSGEPFIGRSMRMMLNRGPGGPLEECFFDFVYQPMLDEAGRVEGIVGVAFDVTDLANARRGAESANRAKDEFLAMLGHELRNPLAPILTALQLMQLRGTKETERERTLIERQVKHLVRLVDDLLDVSRVTRGKVELKREKVELATVVEKAIEQASPLIEQREHTLTVDVPRQGLRLDADPTRLAQVFSNLLTNAAKYTEPGGRISVTAVQEGGEAVIRVRDNGTGIDPETLPRVFERFVQERQALDRSQGGLGLGLAIVRSMVSLHGGRVNVHSEGRGRGSEFTVRLPLMEAGEVQATAAPVQAEPGPPARNAVPGRILVVDDNRDAADILSESLEVLGCETQVAYDGPSALKMAETFQPEVALLDIGLPVMDGYELARLLRQRHADRGLRLIAVTGYGQASDRQQSKEAGFDAHLVKPLDLDVLESLLKRLAAS